MNVELLAGRREAQSEGTRASGFMPPRSACIFLCSCSALRTDSKRATTDQSLVSRFCGVAFPLFFPNHFQEDVQVAQEQNVSSCSCKKGSDQSFATGSTSGKCCHFSQGRNCTPPEGSGSCSSDSIAANHKSYGCSESWYSRWSIPSLACIFISCARHFVGRLHGEALAH